MCDLIPLMVDRFNQNTDRYLRNTVNVETLKKRLDQERKKDKTKNILVATAAISAVAVSGFILSL